MPPPVSVSIPTRTEQQALFDNELISATAWFYEADGERIGPITANKFLDLLFAETIAVDTMVWRPGLGDWVRAGSLAELRGHFLQGRPWREPAPLSQPTPASAWARLLARLFDRQ